MVYDWIHMRVTDDAGNEHPELLETLRTGYASKPNGREIENCCYCDTHTKQCYVGIQRNKVDDTIIDWQWLKVPDVTISIRKAETRIAQGDKYGPSQTVVHGPYNWLPPAKRIKQK